MGFAMSHADVETPAVNRPPRFLLAILLCSCASFDGDPPELLPAGPAVAGAPANPLAGSGQVAPVAEYSAALASFAAGATSGLAEIQRKASRHAMRATSVNARVGAPSFAWADAAPPSDVPAIAARAYIDHFRGAYELAPEAVASAELRQVHDTGRGAIVASFGQAIGGVEIYGVGLHVIMGRDNRLVAMSGNLHPAARAGGALPELTLAPDAAVEIAAGDAAGAAAELVSRRVRPVLYPLAKALEHAHLVEIELAAPGSTDSRAYTYVIAGDGRVLERINRTVSDSFNYRVWADPAPPHRPLDGPQGDWSPHPTGEPDDVPTVFVPAEMVAMEGFNTNPSGGVDPWLPAGATETRGNNVDAYADHQSPSGFSDGDLRADVTGAGTFDHIFDPELDPFDSAAQIKGSVVQIFYTVNWLHDFYYDSGFNEEARVAQTDNFGRGGEAGDPLLAEAQDTRGDQRNNANMSTPSDGMSPRMQMYVWNGPVEFVGETTLEITAPASIAGSYDAAAAQFGVDTEVGASGPMAMASPADGCAAISGVAGQIALIDRGTCTFVEKAQNAAAAGATAVIIANNQPGGPPPLGGDDDSLSIPVLGVSLDDGATFKDALAADPVSADANRAGRVRGADRDGTVDNAIVAHEWGHYFHHRLSFCGGTQQCGAMSEGWGDFMSVQLVLREGDDLGGVYGVPSFVSGDPYFGIRRVPYSVDFARNALTFEDIGASAELPADEHPMRVFGPNNEVHNAGEVWTAMLFEAYVALQREGGHGFAETERRFSDYLVAGLLASPPNGTFTEVRDSILAAAAARDADDMLIMAEGFARRGAGSGARSPERSSRSMDGVVESYEVAGEIALAELDIVNALDCDGDDNWDGGESATLAIKLANTGPLPLDETGLEVTSDHPGLSFPEGNQARISSLDGFGNAVAEIAVALDESLAGADSIAIQVTARNGQSLSAEISADIVRRVNIDDLPASSTTDDVESRIVAWESKSTLDAIQWTRSAPFDSDDRLQTVWYASDPSTQADQRLESPLLEVGDAPLVISFDHRHRFEQSDGTNWDGGVIELSADGGATWNDVGAPAGYGGVLTDESSNPLGGREAFVGESPDWPEMTRATLDLGTAYAGQSVQIRFRLGSDQAAGAEGWEIDNLSFAGITNSPFASVVADAGDCDEVLESEGGCGCASSGGSGGGLLLILAAFALGFRWRRQRGFL
jgi:MYXO-CTERM domain-containing protein